MLSVGQRAKLMANIPEDLASYTVKKLRKDRLGNDDYEYPTMRVSILTQGIRVRPSTGGTIRKNWDGYQGDVQQWYGEHQRATINITVLCESEVAGTDQTTPETLDQILYDLQQEISIWRLGLWWPEDFMKVIPGSAKVTYLPPIMAPTVEHWIYPASLDFTIEYEFSAIDPTPNIHAIQYDWSISEAPLTTIYDYHPPTYGMSVILFGNYRPLLMDTIIRKDYSEQSYGMGMILILD